MNTRRRYQSSSYSFGLRTSNSAGLLRSTMLSSSYRNREPSDYLNQKLVNPSGVATDVSSIHKRNLIHSCMAKEKNYQNKHFLSASITHCQEEKFNTREDIPGEKDSLKDLISKTSEAPASPDINQDNKPLDVNPLTEMEIQSAAQWRAVSGRVSWKLEKTAKQEKQSKGKRLRGRQRIHATPRDRAR